MTWLNWPLKLHFGLRTIPHLILTHNTQVLVQLLLISFVWLYMIKSDVYAQLLVDQTQKDSWVFYMFLKVFLSFRALSFCLKMHFCVVIQKLLQRHFHEKLATKLFPRKEVKEKTRKHKISDRNFCDCLESISWLKASHEKLCASDVFFASNFTSM